MSKETVTLPAVDSAKPFTGWHMLAIMIAFFAVIISVNLFMATSAFRSWTGLVVQNSYVASQGFNAELLKSRAQADLNWQVDLHYADGLLTFNLTDQDGVAVAAKDVVIELTRPIGISEDRTLALTPVEHGFAVANDIPQGVWNATITAEATDFPLFEYRARLLVDGGDAE